MTRNNYWKIIIFIVLFLILSLLSLNRHSRAGISSYHSEIWSDKAGYYVYLPAFFIYNFEANKFPNDIDLKTGNGFLLDKTTNKVVTKYSYGVALMQSPFFLGAHFITKQVGKEADGFSILYNKMIDISAVFYALSGLLLLYLFLINYINYRIVIFSLAILFFGSNLFYYAIFDTGMSHIYSFFLFSTFLYLSNKIFKDGSKLWQYIIFGLVVGLIIAVRPVNILFLPVFLFFNSKIKLKYSIFVIFFATLVMLPQLFYWKYLSGNLFLYTYNNEGFTNFFNPKILQLWFSTNNGLFLYNPMILLSLIGLFFLRKTNSKFTYYLSGYFILISYIFSSWWSWSYGCSYGCRPYVEYYTLLSFPLCFCSEYILKSSSKKFFLLIIILLALWNLKLIFSYDGCWNFGDWDWSEFKNLLFGSTK